MHKIIPILFATILIAGCKTPTKTSGTDETPVAAVPTTHDDPGPGNSQPPDDSIFGPIKDPAVKAEVATVLRDIHFAYDSATILPNDAAVLQAIAGLLKKHRQVLLKIEGHCDERGTEEYNVALGSRRANAARETLIGLGIESKRLFTISYGEMQPIAPGHDETAWAQNRRAHFVGGEAK